MLKVLSLFSGIGAFEKALERLKIDYELVNYCEIDKYASKSYSIIHNVSEDKNLWDVTKVDTDKLPKDIDLLTHGSPCFTGDTLVLTKDGYKQIKDITIGDYVLDHTNSYNEVINFFNQGKKKIWEIKPMCSDIIKTTENHKFLTRTRYRIWNNDKRTYDRKFYEPKWKECKDLTKDDYVGYAINQNSIIPTYEGVYYTRGDTQYKVCNLNMNDKRLWYLCGRYLGDGWLTNRKERNNNLSLVKICCGKHKDGQIEKEVGDLFHFTKTEERTVLKYYFSNKELALFLEQFGRGAKNKKIPSFVYDLPVDYIAELLRGYWDSDGYVTDNGLYKATSISRELIYGIGHLIAKVYHRPFSIYYTKRKPECVIENRTVHQNDTYNITFKKDNCKQDKAFYEDGYLWFPINSIKETDRYENVYDIEVANTHSLTANGVIAHNCQDFSLAGKQAGGDKDSGTRSSLMYETIRIIEKLKPKYVVWENVKNLLSKKHRHNFDNYLKALEDLGYQNYYQVLNAKDYGIPQNRERVFTISILGNENYKFPQGEECNNKIDRLFNFSARQDCRVVYDNNGLCPTLVAGMGEGGGKVPMFIDKDFEFPKGKELEKLPIDLIEENADKKYDLTEKNIEHYQREFGSKGKELNLYEPIPTLTASMGTGGGNIPYFVFPPKQALKLKLKDMLEDNVDEKYYLSDKMIKYISATGTANFKNPDSKINLDVASPLTTDQNKRAGTTNYLSKDLPDNYNLNEVVRKYGIFDTEKSTHQAGSVYDDNGLSPTLDTMQGGYRQPCIEIKNATKKGYLEAYEGDGVNISSRMKYQRDNVQKESIQTLTTSGGNDRGVVLESKCKRLESLVEKTDFEEGKVLNMDLYNQTTNENISQCLTEPHHNSQRLFDGLRIRKLTPKECWRLMGFDDEDIDKCIKAGISDTQLYKQAGNSIVVNVLEAIFRELFKESINETSTDIN